MSTIDHSKLKHLAIFATVIERGSFAQAAKALNTSRSRVSEQVAQLEEILGVRLIQRSTRKLSLTEEGVKVHELAKALPSLVECVNDIASSKEPSGKVTLSLSNDVAQSYLLPKLEEFKKRFPKIMLNLILNDNTSNLINEDVDLAIRTSFRENSSLVTRTLRRERAGIYASTEYITKYGKPQSISELENHHWLTLSQVSNDGSQLFYLSEDSRVTIKPKRLYACNSPYIIQQMLLYSLGIGVILPSSMHAEIESGQLVSIMPELQGPELTVSLLYPSRHQVPKRTRCVIDFLLGVDPCH
ncbi:MULTISPECIES: LysR family transcriptional regulator [Vibrio]|uniref:LysR family transcriptional regulator n=1 Tax=Vibrio TaxID=662 RepID=UPI0018653EF5|nr:LysR family transcriptional regulator [Vibrio bathopelagicus]